jgi:hypothetical protein
MRPPRWLGARDLGAGGIGMHGRRGPNAEKGRGTTQAQYARSGARRGGGGVAELGSYFF